MTKLPNESKEENLPAQILDFLKFSEKIKTQNRDNILSSGRKESVADHSWQVALMAMLVHPHLETKLDLFKVLKMIIIHDITEAEIGDIPFSVSYLDPEIKKKKKKEELAEIEKIRGLAGKVLGEEIYSLWHELEERESLESKFVKALDCMEANYQAILFESIEYWDDIYYDLVLTKSDKHCEHDKFLQKVNKEIKKRTLPQMRKIGLDVEKLSSGIDIHD